MTSSPRPRRWLFIILAPVLPAAVALQTDQPCRRSWSPRSFASGAGELVLEHSPTKNFGMPSRRGPDTRLHVGMLSTLEADPGEMVAGGERYENVRLPDSMVDCTVWVGSLCEFVTDDMLSDLFSEVSTLSSVPACVARNPNASSRKYGFVTFPTVQEKEAAIIRLSGREVNGRKIKVEPIIDKPGQNRVRVPGKIVAYVLGFIPKEGQDHGKRKQSKNKLQRISKADVDRMSRGQPVRKKGRGSRDPPPRLQESDARSFERASKNGYVTLEGTGYRRGRKGSPLANIHRQWCDARAKPQIILCKASGGRPLDNIIVDISPLRLGALSSDTSIVDEFLTKWKTDILTAAENAGMSLKSEYVEDNSEKIVFELDDDDTATRTEYVITVDSGAWANEPISYLPAISMGVFEGERSNAKAMAKALSQLWQVPDVEEPEILQATPRRDTNNGRRQVDSERKRAGRAKMKSKMKGLRQHREKRRGNKHDCTYW